ncbi:MAG: phytochelatin synthase [Alphaproteobacteria bacterium]|nr:phytochelatin synthase [Alphaproteobacteria bacterium]
MRVAVAAGIMYAAPAAGATLVEWSSEESAERFSRAEHKVDFFPLSNHFVGQDNRIYCGPASSAIVLNALRLGKREGLPQDRSAIDTEDMAWLPVGFDPFLGKYTPNNVLTEGTKTVAEVLGKPIEIAGEWKKDFGLQLRQLAQALRVHGLSVTMRVVNDGAEPELLRDELADNLATADNYVLINYSRKALGQSGGGHISPLGAYDRESDSFLVMDVNPNRAPWVWVKAADLIAAMQTFDTVENRGYLLISEGQ